jgi:AraC-like DNA-binding protein
LKKFCRLFLALAVLYLVLQSGFLISGTALITSEIILSVLMAIVVLLLGYWVLDISQLFPAVSNLKKYQTSPLSEEQSNSIQRALIKAMEEQELYLNPRLKIADMAKSLQVPSHHLSQVLNDQMQMNFYQLINSYRIARSKKLLRTDRVQQISIQGIGYDCGFSNKTSFYRAFKKLTGMTPAEFAGLIKN